MPRVTRESDRGEVPRGGKSPGEVTRVTGTRQRALSWHPHSHGASAAVAMLRDAADHEDSLLTTLLLLPCLVRQ